MIAINKKMKLMILGIILVIIVSPSYFLINTPQQPETCTINETMGKMIIIDKTMDNAVICTKVNDSVVLQLGLWDRVGGQWYISNSSGLHISDGVVTMFDQYDPGFGTIEWNITTISPGTQTLNAKCKIVFGDGSEKLLSSQNLTFIVR
jgi:predicted secreted protein